MYVLLGLKSELSHDNQYIQDKSSLMTRCEIAMTGCKIAQNNCSKLTLIRDFGSPLAVENV